MWVSTPNPCICATSTNSYLRKFCHPMIIYVPTLFAYMAKLMSTVSVILCELCHNGLRYLKSTCTCMLVLYEVNSKLPSYRLGYLCSSRCSGPCRQDPTQLVLWLCPMLALWGVRCRLRFRYVVHADSVYMHVVSDFMYYMSMGRLHTVHCKCIFHLKTCNLHDFISTLQYNTKSTVCLCPQILKATRGGQSYMQSVVKPVIIKLQQFNNIPLNTTILNWRNKKQDDMKTKTGG